MVLPFPVVGGRRASGARTNRGQEGMLDIAKDLPDVGRPASGACDVLGRTCARGPARHTIPRLRKGPRNVIGERPHFIVTTVTVVTLPYLWGSFVTVPILGTR
jgi:hypothetical protein